MDKFLSSLTSNSTQLMLTYHCEIVTKKRDE